MGRLAMDQRQRARISGDGGALRARHHELHARLRLAGGAPDGPRDGGGVGALQLLARERVLRRDGEAAPVTSEKARPLEPRGVAGARNLRIALQYGQDLLPERLHLWAA